jgi:Cu+-exporting ATPase
MAETTVTFKLRGMTCTMCALAIEKQLSNQEGVTSANVNFALGNATVTYDPKRIAPKQLVEAIRDVGYDVDIERAELQDLSAIAAAFRRAKSCPYFKGMVPARLSSFRRPSAQKGICVALADAI